MNREYQILVLPGFPSRHESRDHTLCVYITDYEWTMYVGTLQAVKLFHAELCEKLPRIADRFVIQAREVSDWELV